MTTQEKILEYVRKKPMSTADEITGELSINYNTVIASLSTLKRKGKVKATDSWPIKYAVPPKKSIKGGNGQGFMDYLEDLNRKYEELKAENTRLCGELGECQRKLVKLAQRIVRQNIYGNH